MAARYICGEEGRRRAVRNSAVVLNGVDFLEVSDDQLTLSVHFLKTPIPAGIELENVVIEGGVRVTGINATGLVAGDDTLNVTVSTRGDFSRYTLRLVNVDGLDERLSVVQFSFKVNCPTDFDCQPADRCPPATFPEPDIDYLARDYASFRQLMLDRLALLVPGWHERNPADLGVTLVEMLAYVGDHLSYFLDAVGTEAYLGTARRRTSVRRHARLRDYSMHEGANARTYVTFAVEAASSADGATLAGPANGPHGTRVLTRRDSDEAVLSEVEAGAMIFETLHDVTLHAAHNGIAQNGEEIVIRFYAWSDEQCCLPKGATAATLRGPLPNLKVGELLLFEEARGARTGEAADADPSRRHVVRVKNLVPAEDPLDGTPVVEIEWAQADALPFPFCLSSINQAGAAIEDVSIARGNVVLADHGETRTEEGLIFTGDGQFGRTLRYSPLTHSVPLPVDHAQRPAAELRQTSAQGGIPQIRLTRHPDEGGQRWEVRRDLLGSGSGDRHFVAEMEEDGRARIRFGVHSHGLRPEDDARFTASYRVGNGPEGNVGARAIAHVVGAPAGIRSVRNPLPAWGGESPESVDQVRAYAPHAFKVQERAVTEDDYARMAERHPEVQRAAATFRWTGSWNTVFLTIDRRGGLPVPGDNEFTETLLRHMGRFRMAGHDLEIDGPRFVPLDIAVTICVEPEYFRGEIKAELLERLGNGVLPDGRRAFFHPDDWTFGQSVYLSQIYATIMAVTGINSAEAMRFQRWGRSAAGELNAGVLRVDRLEVVRLDNDPNFQENGRLTLNMRGGR